MIKIQNNTPTREALPAFLLGLKLESLADLSWTDPSLGVSDCKWLPEVDASPALNQYEKYEGETFKIVGATVEVTKGVIPWTTEEINQFIKSQVPQVVTMRQAELALLNANLLDDIEVLIPTLPRVDQISWTRASTVERNNPLVAYIQSIKGLSDTDIDNLFIQAAGL